MSFELSFEVAFDIPFRCLLAIFLDIHEGSKKEHILYETFLHITLD